MSKKALETKDHVVWQPQQGPQALFIQCPAFEVLYGGAVGGGKTDALLGDFAAGLGQGPAWKGVFFRRYFPDMDDVIHRALEIFGPVYGEKCYSHSRYQWKFPGGELLQFRALEKDVDVYKFQGQQYAWVGWDELTQWASPFPYTYLMTRVRSAKGAKVRVRAATNPGGPGHTWVKARFIDPAIPGEPIRIETKSGNTYWRVFVPAKLEDNKILLKGDPGYADRVYELHDPMMARALREGDWNIVAGAALPEWDPNIHIIDTAPMPTERPIWRSMDWGYETPYGCVWMFPDDGDIVVGHELYGWSGVPNVGTQEAPSVVRDKIASFESMNDYYVRIGYLDNQCWEPRGGAGPIVRELGGRQMGWRPWAKGPHSRVQQLQTLHEFMKVVNGRSRFKVMRHCRHVIRTLPILPRDQKNPEDVDTNAEDHLYDAVRGGLAMKVPTRDELRARAAQRRMLRTGYITAKELRYGGF